MKKEPERALNGECTAQKRWFVADVEMDRTSWEKTNLILLFMKPTTGITEIGATSSKPVTDRTKKRFLEISVRRTESTKNFTQEIVKKCMNYEEFAVSKRMKSDT